MAVQTINPIPVSNVSTSATPVDIPGAAPAAGEEWSLALRVANKTGAAILYRLYLTLAGDNAQASGSYRAYDFSIPANDARDIESALLLPSGYKLQHRASATGLDVSVTARKRATA